MFHGTLLTGEFHKALHTFSCWETGQFEGWWINNVTNHCLACGSTAHSPPYPCVLLGSLSLMMGTVRKQNNRVLQQVLSRVLFYPILSPNNIWQNVTICLCHREDAPLVYTTQRIDMRRNKLDHFCPNRHSVECDCSRNSYNTFLRQPCCLVGQSLEIPSHRKRGREPLRQNGNYIGVLQSLRSWW